MSTLLDVQLKFMKEMGYLVNTQPGLTESTRDWEDRIKRDFYHLQVSATLLHQTMSADSVAAVLLESVTMMQNLIGLLTNIGVNDKIEPAFLAVIEAQRNVLPRPNLLSLVLDRG